MRSDSGGLRRSHLELERTWMNLWTAARLAGALGELEEAIRAGEEAVAVCQRDSEYCPYVSTYRSSIAEWRRLLSPL